MTMHKKRTIVWQLYWLPYYRIGNSYINVKLTTVDIGLEFLSLYMLWYRFLICRCTSSKKVDSQNCWLAHTACSCIHVYANCITPGDNFYNIKYIAVVSDINLVTWKLLNTVSRDIFFYSSNCEDHRFFNIIRALDWQPHCILGVGSIYSSTVIMKSGTNTVYVYTY